jgi:CRP/FNR family cyclic AMP-dependent transcriptional regulator
MRKPSEFAVLLNMSPLFAALGEQTVEQIAALCAKRRLAAGEVLFKKGDEADALYGVRRGTIRIETGTGGGSRLTLNVLGSGDMFGEVALIDGHSRTADAVAADACELFVLRRRDFLAFIQRDPRIMVQLMELLCQRIRWMSERMEEMAFLPLRIRLARRLVALTRDYGAEVHITQDELADLVGAARERVNRQLQVWRREKILTLGRGRIVISNSDRLSGEAHQGGLE